MTIPAWHDIPEGAHDALERAMDATGTEYGPNTADYYIAAAWPHLYAAARKDVLEEMRERSDEIEGSKIDLEGGRVLWLHTAAHVDDWLCRMAEAGSDTPEPAREV